MSPAARRAWMFFAASLAVYQANLRPVASWDSVPAALLPLSICFDGSLRLDRFGPWIRENIHPTPYFFVVRDGHHYSAYPVAQSVLLAPLYSPLLGALGAKHWGPGEQLLLARVLEKFFAATLAAASVALFYRIALAVAPPGVAPWLSVIYAFATPAWATLSQALWQHTGGVLLLLAALRSLIRWTESRASSSLLWAGIWAGVAITVRPTNLFFAAAAAAVLALGKERPAQWARFLLPVAACAAATALFNLWLTGDARGVQSQGLDWSVFPGVAGALVSPSRGLLIYCPFFVFAGAGLRWGWPRPWYRIAAVYCILHLAFIGLWPLWWGGACWGPRLLSEIAPFLVLMLAPVVESAAASSWRKYILVPLVAWAVFLQFLGAFFYPKGHWDDRSGRSSGISRYWDWSDSPIRRTLAAGIATEPYQVLWEGLRKGPAAGARKMRELKMRGL